MDNAVSYIYHPHTVCDLAPIFSPLARNAEQPFNLNLLVSGAMLQDGRSRVRFTQSLHFSIDLIIPAALWP
jgi:hypothetical protein